MFCAIESCTHLGKRFATCTHVQEDPHRQSRRNCGARDARLPRDGHPVGRGLTLTRIAPPCTCCKADEAYHIGPAAATESYLNFHKILEVAKRSGADAIHPGYGFLSENAKFAQACADAGVKFIGPTAAAMEMMGSKTRARQHMEIAGVPFVPGTSRGLDSVEQAPASGGQDRLPRHAEGGRRGRWERNASGA